MRSRNLVTPTNETKVSELLSVGQSKLGRTPKTKNSEHPNPKPTVDIQVDYKELVTVLLKLDALNDAQKRGYEFEKYLNKLFSVFGLEPHTSYRTDTDQIDGSFILNGNTILLEAKYRAAQLSKNDLILFHESLLYLSQKYMMCSQEKDLRDVLTRKFRYLDEYGIIYRHINLLF